MNPVVQRLIALLRENLVIFVVSLIAFALIWHQRGLDDALWITGTLSLVLAQIIVVVYSLVYGVYHERPGSWYLPTLCVLIAYYWYLVSADQIKMVIAHSIVSIAPGILLFGLVARSRRAHRD